jgi:ubiquinone/menaquinone biosynthesis C-methylase UbiE
MISKDSKSIHDLYSTGEDFEQMNYDGVGAYPYAKYRMKMVLEVLEKHSCDKILDLGCSTGRVVRDWIMLGHQGEGIDFSEDLISQGRKKMEQANIDSNCLSVGDVRDLSKIESDTYDAVLALGLHPFMSAEEELKNYNDT